MSYRAGNRLRLTDDGRPITIWSPAPGPGCYWAHLGDGEDRRMVLVRITEKRDATRPIVTVLEEQ